MHLIDDRAAVLELVAAQRLLVEVARGLDLDLPIVVAQHQETALGFGQLDDRIHDLIEHGLQIERRAEQAADAVERFEPPLLFQLFVLLFEPLEQVDHALDLLVEKARLDAPALKLRAQQVEVVAHTADFAVL